MSLAHRSSRPVVVRQWMLPARGAWNNAHAAPPLAHHVSARADRKHAGLHEGEWGAAAGCGRLDGNVGLERNTWQSYVYGAHGFSGPGIKPLAVEKNWSYPPDYRFWPNCTSGVVVA